MGLGSARVSGGPQHGAVHHRMVGLADVDLLDGRADYAGVRRYHGGPFGQRCAGWRAVHPGYLPAGAGAIRPPRRAAGCGAADDLVHAHPLQSYRRQHLAAGVFDVHLLLPGARAAARGIGVVCAGRHLPWVGASGLQPGAHDAGGARGRAAVAVSLAARRLAAQRRRPGVDGAGLFCCVWPDAGLCPEIARSR